MSKELELAALRMGYRNVSANIMFKPLGYSLLSINTRTYEFKQILRWDDESNVIWAIDTISQDNPLESLKNLENNILVGLSSVECSSFHFLTMVQMIEQFSEGGLTS